MREAIHLERFRPSPFYLELDGKSGALRRVFRFGEIPVSGFYDQIGDVQIALYRLDDALFFRIDERVIPLDERVSSRWIALAEDRARFSLSIGDQVVFECDYAIVIRRLDAADLGFESGRNDFLRAVHGMLADRTRWGGLFRDQQLARRVLDR